MQTNKNTAVVEGKIIDKCKCGEVLDFKNNWETTCENCGRAYTHTSTGSLSQMSLPAVYKRFEEGE